MTRHYFDEEYNAAPTSPTEADREDYLNDLEDPNGMFESNDTDGIYDDYWCNREYIERSDIQDSIQWEQLKIGKTLLLICSTGLIRRSSDPFWCVTKGVPLTGTPYSYVMIETEDNVYRRYFVHHLVWKAFQGDVPTGWEVRHKPTIPMEYTREYPNDLSMLDIYPITASSCPIVSMSSYHNE